MSQVFKSYSNIFSPINSKSKENDNNARTEDTETISISQHYGWFYTIYQLSETNILSISGDKAITDVNLFLALNYLSLKQELNEQERQKLAQQQRQRIL